MKTVPWSKCALRLAWTLAGSVTEISTLRKAVHRSRPAFLSKETIMTSINRSNSSKYLSRIQEISCNKTIYSSINKITDIATLITRAQMMKAASSGAFQASQMKPIIII